MKRRTALQSITAIMASYFQVPQVTSEEFKTLSGTCNNCKIFIADKPQKFDFELQLADVKEIHVRWGESVMVIHPQELWDALHRNE